MLLGEALTLILTIRQNSSPMVLSDRTGNNGRDKISLTINALAVLFWPRITKQTFLFERDSMKFSSSFFSLKLPRLPY